MSVNKIYEKKKTTYEYSASVYHYHLLIIIKLMIKDLGSDTSSVWNFCSRSSDVISRGKCRLFYHSTIQRANV